MRVVFVTTVFEGVDTGPGIYANYLWRALRNDPDVEFHVVAPVFAESHPRLHASGKGSGSLELYRRVQDLALEVVSRSPGTTIVHGNSTHSMGRLARYRGPLIVQVNDYETATLPSTILPLLREAGLRKVLSTAWRYRHEAEVLRCATIALCNSEYTAAVVRRHYDLSPSKVRVLHKAVDITDFVRPEQLPPDPAPGRQPGSRILFVGTDWRRKGLDGLLRALPPLVSTHSTLSLLVIGPDAADARLQAAIRDVGLDDRVFVVGRAAREVLARYLWYSDVLVLPSRREALGVAVLEGMAAGLPVVATKGGGIPEMVRSGIEGLLVSADDVEALRAAVDLLLLDAPLRDRMRIAALRRAEDFSVATMVRRLKEQYASVLREQWSTPCA